LLHILFSSGELGNDPAERTVVFCRPCEPEPGNTGGGKHKVETQNKQQSRPYKPIFQTKVLSEIIVFVALAGALSLVSHSIFSLPESGSINIGMVPIFWLALRRGPKIGIFAGAVFGVVDLIVSPFAIVHPLQFILDYPLAFAFLGIAGFFRKLTVAGPAIGVLAGGVGRFIFHFVSGVIFFSMYAPEGMNPLLYSAIYNATYMAPAIVVCIAIILLLQKSNLLDIYK
jgi:thiamine transporter